MQASMPARERRANQICGEWRTARLQRRVRGRQGLAHQSPILHECPKSGDTPRIGQNMLTQKRQTQPPLRAPKRHALSALNSETRFSIRKRARSLHLSLRPALLSHQLTAETRIPTPSTDGRNMRLQLIYAVNNPWTGYFLHARLSACWQGQLASLVWAAHGRAPSASGLPSGSSLTEERAGARESPLGH